MKRKTWHKVNSDEWKKLCNKKYTIKKGSLEHEVNFDKEELFSQLQCEKTKLNEVKSLLNDFDIAMWHHHTKSTHMLSPLPYMLRRTLNVELATQAWAKFYAILKSCNLFGAKYRGKILKTVHLCEAPGAFVTSLNHFLKNDRIPCVGWQWTATTLNPHYEGNELGKMIPDDRFLIETLDRWDFGADFTGNIMSVDNWRHFKNKFEDQDVHLVTADGSIDCSDKPDEQEVTVALLLFWEIIYALNILSDGGSFVLKIFTMFENFTVTAMYLLTQVFDKVSLLKPSPSKPGNSEVYVIGEEFHKDHCFSLQLFQDFQECVLNGDLSCFDEILDYTSISNTFMESILHYVSKSCHFQKEAILKNIEIYHGNREEVLHRDKKYFAKKFIDEFGITKIDDCVSPLFLLKSCHGNGNNQRFKLDFRTGSFNQRKAVKHDQEIEVKEKEVPICVKSLWYKSEFQLSYSNLAFTTGKKIVDINTSTICSSHLLKKYKEREINIAVGDDNNGILELCQVLISDFPPQDEIVIFVQNHHWNEVFKHFFKEHGKSLTIHTSYAENMSDSSAFMFCQLGNSLTGKTDLLRSLRCSLMAMRRDQNLVLVLEELVLTNFWAGVIFVVSTYFNNFLYFAPGFLNGHVYLVFKEWHHSSTSSDKLFRDIDCILERLECMPADVDVLHVLPLYLWIHGDFCNYLKGCNDYFIKKYC